MITHHFSAGIEQYAGAAFFVGLVVWCVYVLLWVVT